MPLNCPKLWIVATPIGNPGDLSPRAREIISGVGLVLAEDTRRASKLFRECGIPMVRLASLHDHNEEDRIADAINAIQSGMDVAVVSDAGTPLIADPGYRLVQACHRHHIPVSPIPGPSAPVAALSAAGLPPIPYTFLGFLPRDEKGIRDLFTVFSATPGSIVFFERKDRLCRSLALARDVLGEREIAICRELTKTHEEFIFGQLGNSQHICADLLGELTVIIGPSTSPVRTSEHEVKNLLEAELNKGIKLRKAASETQRHCMGWTVKEIYDLGTRL